MKKISHPALLWQRSFNTLAQNETSNSNKTTALIVGNGSELGSAKVLQGRAKRKAISQTLALKMIEIAELKKSPDKLKPLWNTYHCQNKVCSHDGRLYGKYCKNRFCTLCNSIRKAEIINRYYPELNNWEDPYFVTLTVKACSKGKLGKMFKGLIRAFRRINAKYRKRNQRGNGFRLVGIKSLECNFNPKLNTYNPHLHLIVPCKEIADIMINEWLEIWTPKFTTRKAQDARPVKDLEKDLVEIIKYGSKIFTEPDANNKIRGKVQKVYVAALYNIYEAMKGLRIFERFGFNLPKHEKQHKGARLVTDFYQWEFLLSSFDWQNTDNELVLSAYHPEPKLASLLENDMDIEKE